MWKHIKRFGARYSWVKGIAGASAILFLAVTMGGLDPSYALTGFAFVLFGLGIRYAIKHNR